MAPSTASFRSSTSSTKQSRTTIDSFVTSPMPSKVDLALGDENTELNAATDCLLLQWSLEKVSEYLTKEKKLHEIKVASNQALLTELESKRWPESRRLATARSFVTDHDIEAFEIMEPEGIATQSYTFKLLKATKDSNLYFDLTTKFPIRRVDRLVLPETAVDKRRATWVSDRDPLGMRYFREQLKVKKTQSCTARVTLYGRKKEIYHEGIMLNKSTIQEAQDLLGKIAREVEKAEKDLAEAKSRILYYGGFLEICAKDLKIMTAVLDVDSKTSIQAKSFHRLAAKMSLNTKIEQDWFPDIVNRVKVPLPLIAEQIRMLETEEKYLKDQQTLARALTSRREDSQDSVRLKLRAKLRNPGINPSDIFDNALEGILKDCKAVDNSVSEDADGILGVLNENWDEFEKLCIEGLIESKSEMLEDADAAWIEAEKNVQNTIKKNLQEQKAYIATKKVLEASAVSIGVFASVDHNRDMWKEYHAIYHDMVS